MGPNEWVQIDGTKKTGPNRWVKINLSKYTGQNGRV